MWTFWQKVCHSVGNYKNVKTCQQCMSLMEKNWISFICLNSLIFGYCIHNCPLILQLILVNICLYAGTLTQENPNLHPCTESIFGNRKKLHNTSYFGFNANSVVNSRIILKNLQKKDSQKLLKNTWNPDYLSERWIPNLIWLHTKFKEIKIWFLFAKIAQLALLRECLKAQTQTQNACQVYAGISNKLKAF